MITVTTTTRRRFAVSVALVGALLSSGVAAAGSDDYINVGGTNHYAWPGDGRFWTLTERNDDNRTLVRDICPRQDMINGALDDGVWYYIDWRIDGLGGNDTLFGSCGDDIIFGGAGKDTIKGGTNDDQLYGGSRPAGAACSLASCASSGYVPDSSPNKLYGGAGNDLLWGGHGRDILEGGDGADRIRGLDENDKISGGAGDDTIAGDYGNDRIWGGGGADTIDAGPGDDVIYVHEGADVDTVNCGSGYDTVYIDDNGLFGGSVADVVTNCEVVLRQGQHYTKAGGIRD